MSVLQFAPFKSAIGVAFWHSLAKRKLDVYGLSDAAVPLRGSWCAGSALLHLDYDSFDEQAKAPGSFHLSSGSLLNSNTLESYKKLPLKKLLEDEAAHVWAAVVDGSWESDFSSLVRVLVACYADLKRHEFRYVVAFPALRFASGEVLCAQQGMRPLDAVPGCTGERLAELGAVLDACPVALVPSSGPVLPLSKTAWATAAAAEGWAAHPTVAIADPCDDISHPGWPLRNLLMALAVTHGVKKLTVLCVRQKGGVAFDLELPEAPDKSGPAPASVGWEIAGPSSSLHPRVVSLAHTMDPLLLADNAVDLNLKLMRWRMFPTLDLARIQSAKCLLLGAGTLGCNVARALLGWGVRNFTFVDNGRVSFSNPVRQSLFTFEDCLNGGRFKAEAAAERIKAIFPAVKAEGKVVTIPMPGHYVSKADEARTKAATEQLEALVASHDVVFLLSDSRECRWLPTLLGAAMSKLVITVGLGFESFVVMRHGVPEAGKDRVGCYFCSDVVAPRDSITDRTLDQACTVTRPGLSFMASALAAELLVTVFHHPLGAAAPANATGCPLGPAPHQLRGFLSEWNTVKLAGEASPMCVACSPHVVDEYKKRGFEFLLEVYNNPAFLEELSGINEMRRQQEKVASEGVQWATAEEDDF